MHIVGLVILGILGTTLLLQFTDRLEHGGQETRVEVALGHFELGEARLTFLAGPSKAARQLHRALNLKNMPLFLVTYLS